MIRKLICWLKKEHDWSEWTGQRYTDARTWYWARVCNRCYKIESTLEKPK